MDQSLLIIGGGVAGLAAGCYARMNSYPATILEMADTPGGLCTSWRRDGYLYRCCWAGRKVIQAMCKNDGRQFSSTIA